MQPFPEMVIIRKEYKTGEIIIKTGDIGNEFYSIISGRVGIFIHYGMQNQFKAAELSAGSFFGEAAIMEKTPRSATVVALENTALQVIPLDDIIHAVQSYPDVFLSLIRKNHDKQTQQNNELIKINALLEEICQTNEKTLLLNAKIVDCLNEIQSISRTNTILGINATIEASHAGQLGKGFAVVAQELKQLAERTDQIAKQSQTLIDDCKKNNEASNVKLNAARGFCKKYK